MSLAAGSRLGPYEILAAIGAGGMGEVYRARDTRLDRPVAIKVLPAALAADAQFRERFDREAHAIAALNHPHICTLHDVGEHDGVAFLVMEYLEGETLAARLTKGAMPLDQVLRCAIEIADALDKAHRAGIIHRDLKPGNIMLTRAGAKLLDFGLAKTSASAVAGASLSMLSTAAPHLTAHGTILGTFQYMAPEQLEGKDADARTDIFAFGVVVYEMATGKRPFEGASAASLIAAILEHEPPALSSIQAVTPAAFDRVVGRCLAKDPEARWQDARDLADELRWLVARPELPARTVGHPPAGFSLRIALALGLGAMVLGAMAGALVWRPTPRAPARSAERLVLPVSGSGIELAGAVAISPNERLIAFTARDAAGSRIYVRRIDEWDAHPLNGTEGAQPGQLCFSPDSEWVAFVSMQDRQAAVRRVPLGGGASQFIGSGGGAGIRWASDGRILVARDQPQSGIWSIAAGGGTPQAVVSEDTGRRGRYGWPEVLPSGRGILLTIQWEGRVTIAAFSLESRKLVPLIKSGIRPRYLKGTGHLVYQSDGRLLAVPFDPDRLELTGEARVVADQVGNGAEGVAEYDVSPTGVLAYLPPTTARLVWREAAGTTTPVALKPRRYTSVALSPNGTRAVVNVEEGVAQRVYLADLTSGEPLTRLTPGDDDLFGLFTRDGTRVLFTSGEGGRYNLFSTRADGGGDMRRLTNTPHWQKATSIWPRGPILLLNDIGDGQSDILQLEMDRPGQAALPVVKTPMPDVNGVFSPDGQWIAYEQATSGVQEVYVQAYPTGPRRQVSVDGGWGPVWNPKGGQLFYASNAGLMAARIADGVRLGPPVRLFERPAWLRPDWDVSPDGRRFLMIERAPAREINVVFNWTEELKRLVPSR